MSKQSYWSTTTAVVPTIREPKRKVSNPIGQPQQCRQPENGKKQTGERLGIKHGGLVFIRQLLYLAVLHQVLLCLVVELCSVGYAASGEIKEKVSPRIVTVCETWGTGFRCMADAWPGRASPAKQQAKKLSGLQAKTARTNAGHKGTEGAACSCGNSDVQYQPSFWFSTHSPGCELPGASRNTCVRRRNSFAVDLNGRAPGAAPPASLKDELHASRLSRTFWG